MIFFHGTVKLNACLYDSGVVVGMGWYDGGMMVVWWYGVV